jgi:hypothetical protein
MSAGIELPAPSGPTASSPSAAARCPSPRACASSWTTPSQRHGPDALRFYLLREIPWNGDGEFSWERFDERYTAELADNFGNLASRTISMIERYRGGVVPPAQPHAARRGHRRRPGPLPRRHGRQLLHQGVAAAMELSSPPTSTSTRARPGARRRTRPGRRARRHAGRARPLRRRAGHAAVPVHAGKMQDLAHRLGLDQRAAPGRRRRPRHDGQTGASRRRPVPETALMSDASMRSRGLYRSLYPAAALPPAASGSARSTVVSMPARAAPHSNQVAANGTT